MSKALTKAQADLDALRVELEAWVIVQTELQARQPAKRKPAVRRTRTELITAATTPVVSPIVLSAEVEAEAETDTSWLDLLDSAPVAAPVTASSPAPVVVPPVPTVAPVAAPVALPVAAPVETEKLSARLRREWKENKADLRATKHKPQS